MRRVFLAIAGTVTGLVLLLSFKSHPVTGAAAAPPAAVSLPSAGASAGAAPAPAPTTKAGAPAHTAASHKTKSHAADPAPTTTAAPATRQVTGDAADTPYGPVQISITLTGHTIAKVTPVQVPWGTGRDQEINSFAVPQLMQETLAAQSARIDMVSGATYTSDGYIRSLQSALDKAGA